MLLVETYVAPSAIEGLGLFVRRPVPAGEPVWRFEAGLDQLLTPEQAAALPAAFRAFLDRYAYTTPDFPGRLVLSCDHAKFMNHSENPNTESRGLVSVARRALAAGEEMTCDYRAFVVGWTGFD